MVYSLDFDVTPHQLRHTYITNLIHASVDPKTDNIWRAMKVAKSQWIFTQRSNTTGRMISSKRWAVPLTYGTLYKPRTKQKMKQERGKDVSLFVLPWPYL